LPKAVLLQQFFAYMQLEKIKFTKKKMQKAQNFEYWPKNAGGYPLNGS